MMSPQASSLSSSHPSARSRSHRAPSSLVSCNQTSSHHQAPHCPVEGNDTHRGRSLSRTARSPNRLEPRQYGSKNQRSPSAHHCAAVSVFGGTHELLFRDVLAGIGARFESAASTIKQFSASLEASNKIKIVTKGEGDGRPKTLRDNRCKRSQRDQLRHDTDRKQNIDGEINQVNSSRKLELSCADSGSTSSANACTAPALNDALSAGIVCAEESLTWDVAKDLPTAPTTAGKKEHDIEKTTTGAPPSASLYLSAASTGAESTLENWHKEQQQTHPPLPKRRVQIARILNCTDSAFSLGKRAATDPWLLTQRRGTAAGFHASETEFWPIARSATAPVKSSRSAKVPVRTLPPYGSQGGNHADVSGSGSNRQVGRRQDLPYPQLQSTRNDTRRIPDPPDERPNDGSDAGPGFVRTRPRFSCVFALTSCNFGPECRKQKHFVSQLRRHHKRHGLFYCSTCFSAFSGEVELKRHEKEAACQAVCLAAGCRNRGHPKSEECWEQRHKATQQDEWSWLHHVAHRPPIPNVVITPTDDTADYAEGIESSGLAAAESSLQADRPRLYDHRNDQVLDTTNQQPISIQHPAEVLTALSGAARDVMGLAEDLLRQGQSSSHSEVSLDSALAHLEVIRKQLRAMMGRASNRRKRPAYFGPSDVQPLPHPLRRTQSSPWSSGNHADNNWTNGSQYMAFSHGTNFDFSIFPTNPQPLPNQNPRQPLIIPPFGAHVQPGQEVIDSGRSNAEDSWSGDLNTNEDPWSLEWQSAS